MKISTNKDKIVRVSKRVVPDGSDTTRTPIVIKKATVTETPYKPGRKDPSFVGENPSDATTYPKGENKDKQTLRISTQKAGKETYKYNGKEEFAGTPAKKDTTYSDTTVMKTEIKPKFKVVSDTSYIDVPKRGKINGSRPTQQQERAPGLKGSNKVQRKY